MGVENLFILDRGMRKYEDRLYSFDYLSYEFKQLLSMQFTVHKYTSYQNKTHINILFS